MVQGTSSHVGKSILTAALCRILRDRGFKVAPFKAQNMALNSSVTADGSEIGRAQAFQAEAAGVPPTFDMNPILLKPTGDSLSQVIIHGKVVGVMSARQYHAFKQEAKKFVLESYSRLAENYDVIVIEGAGSPAEINLRENDIANMGVAELVDSPVILAGDIDRGGVFASIVGTMELLTEDERERVKGFIINKFRGDINLLTPGIEFLEKRTNRPVLGVVPYMKDIILPDEDGVALESRSRKMGSLRISVIKLPRISNFTDFDPFKCEDDVELDFIDTPQELHGSHMVIIPGTKNTLEDAKWMKDKGFFRALGDFSGGGGVVWGICGGFQILGKKILDPFGVESDLKQMDGVGLLDTVTTMMKEKNTFQVTATVQVEGRECLVQGYEIHMGETSGNALPFSTILKRNSLEASVKDGAISKDGNIIGTYIHGIFDNDGLRKNILDRLKRKNGFENNGLAKSYAAQKEASFKAVADIVENSLRIDELLNIIGVQF